jgi:hypothetical protein
MQIAPEKRTPDGKALWSIGWRSVILLPLFFPLAVLWLVLVILIGILPFISVAYLWFGEWKQAALHFAIWALLLFAYRRFRLGRWIERPPSVL